MLLNQTSLKKDTVKRGSPLLQIKTEETPLQRLSRETPYMPKKKLTPEQGKKLFEDTRERIRLEQEARTRERLEQLEQQDFESCARLGERLKELTPEQSRQLLEETRNRVKTEGLEFESSSELGDKILNEFWDFLDLQKELENLAKLEEGKEESSSSNTSSQLETPD